MKKLILSAALPLLLAIAAQAQPFWVENFTTSSTTGSTTYTGPNGTWTITSVGSEGSRANTWWFGCAESGNVAGACGTDCSGGTLGATLHVSTNSTDLGAAYDAGLGFTGAYVTSKRAESPVINCTGRTGITMTFYYIENGDASIDDAKVDYYDGSSWTTLVNTPKTPVCSSGQGQWARYSIALPASANGNPNVKIGFHWVNNDDAAGTDPSFAVDSISLRTSGSASTIAAAFTASDTVVCQDSCLRFTSTTTGTVDSMRWSATGATIATPTASPANICFATAGTATVKLKVYGGGSVDSTTKTIRVKNSPHPTVTNSGMTLSVTGTYASYQWYRSGTLITGATNSSYTYSFPGAYTVMVDSGGCKGMSVAYNYRVGLNELYNAYNTEFNITRPSSGTIAIAPNTTLTEDLFITITTYTGKTVYSAKYEQSASQITINTQNWSTGIYFIKISGSNQAKVLKYYYQD
ncbi:MAG: T9SS C-terminal target domain-containing protein [Chitinophagia bacterium]|nr:T9SS C-terminal target domain-containing protein [Chitinophagia bacterium]